MKAILSIALASATCVLSAQVPNEDLIFALNFSNTFNTVIPADFAASANNADLGMDSQMNPDAACFLGENQNVIFNNSTFQAGSTNGEVSVSTKFRADLDFVYNMFDFSYANIFNSGNCFIRIQKTSTYFIQVGLYDGNDFPLNVGYRTISYPVNPEDLNYWTTVTMTFDGTPTAQTLALYVNGSPVASETQNNDCGELAGNVGYENNNMIIGGLVDQPYAGTIDEVFIHNRTISADEASDIYFSQSFVVGLNELQAKSQLSSVYPNPAKDIIQFEGFNNENIEIINAQGAKVMTQKLTIGRNQWDINTLPAGVYFIKTSQGSTKFVKC